MYHTIPSEIYEHFELHGTQQSAQVVANIYGYPRRSVSRWKRYYRDDVALPRVPTAESVRTKKTGDVVFDIEVTDFQAAGVGKYLLCVSFLPIGGEPYTLQLQYDDQRNDRRVLIQVACELAKYRRHIGHNIAAFDYNWLNTRLAWYGLPALDTAQYFDTYQAAKALSIKASGKSLGSLGSFYGSGGIKTSIYAASWGDVFSSDPDVFDDRLDEIIHHCEQDVTMNAGVYESMHDMAIHNGRQNPWKVTKLRSNFWGNLDLAKSLLDDETLWEVRE